MWDKMFLSLWFNSLTSCAQRPWETPVTLLGMRLSLTTAWPMTTCSARPSGELKSPAELQQPCIHGSDLICPQVTRFKLDWGCVTELHIFWFTQVVCLRWRQVRAQWVYRGNPSGAEETEDEPEEEFQCVPGEGHPCEETLWFKQSSLFVSLIELL